MPTETDQEDLPVELFRIAALRAPAPVSGALARIHLEVSNITTPPPPPDMFDPERGVLVGPVLNLGPDFNRVFELRQLDHELSTRDDRWAPSDIVGWVREHTGHDLADIVGHPAWGDFRLHVHGLLQEDLLSQAGTTAGGFRGPVALLRGVRLIGLLDALVEPAVAPADAEAVQRFLRYAAVVLPSRQFPAPGNQLARPPAVADLKVVRLGRPRYEPGAIAHIENVMASEKRERTHRLKEQTETTTTREFERIEENEQDLATSSQVQLQQEAMQALHETTDLEAGLHVTASYGTTVQVDADARVARHDSREEVSRTAATFSNQITQTARQRVVERLRETRTVRHLIETEETNLHGFTNTGPDAEHIVGIYRWVDQVQDAWVENYGKRLMLEFLVPEPAAVLQWAWKTAPAVDDAGPEPPRPKNPSASTEDLRPHHITEDNYLELVGKHGASNVSAPPPPSLELAVTFKPQAEDDLFVFEDSKTLKVPDGYRATGWVAQCVTWGREGDLGHSWMVGVGEAADPQEDNDGDKLKKHLKGALDAGPGSVLPVVMLGRGLLGLSASVRVHCERTVDELNKWRLGVFDRVMEAWRTAHEEWSARKARAEAVGRIENETALLQGAANPEENRVVERRELRRGVIHLLLGQPQDQGGFAGKAVVRPDGDRPTLDLAVAADERDAIGFFEQAFEWPNMTWVHYPYYWADGAQWAASIRRTAADPVWAAFLAAGASRVVVPVRPGFEAAVALYLAIGVLWAGGQVPTVGDPAYLGIAEEIAESLGTGGVPAERTPLEPVRLPTNLLWLQPTSELNPGLDLASGSRS